MVTASPTPPLDIESALAHTAFVRAMARAVLGADEEVEDVVQGTWLVAMKQGPERPVALRAWLGTIARNLAYGVLRRRSSRVRVERRAGKPEDLPSVADLVVEEETRRRLLDAVFAMEEPSRSAILLRYHQGLPVAEVARRLGVPLETARTRLHRGLARLRARLDDAHGGRRDAWCAALLPWANRSGAVPPTVAIAGAVAMKKTAWIAASILLVGFGAWRIGFAPVESEGPPRDAPPPTSLAAEAVPAAQEGPSLAKALPAAPSSGRRRDPSAEPDAVTGAVLTGRVVEEGTERPISGAQVVMANEFARREGEPSAVSGADGAFRVEGVEPRSAESCLVEAKDYAWTVVSLSNEAREAAPGTTFAIGNVKLPRGAAVRGRVVSRPGGAGVVGATLLIGYDHGSGFAPAYAREVGRSGDGGHFAIEHVPPARGRVSWVLFALTAEGLGWATLPASAGKQDLTDVEVAMRPTATLVVRAEDAAGSPSAGAFIRLEPDFAPLGSQGGHSLWVGKRPEIHSMLEGRTDADGVARFDRLPVGDDGTAVYDVVAYAKGFVLSWKDGVKVARGEEAKATVVLLPYRAASLAGIVRDPEGRPFPGAKILVNNQASASTGADGTFRLAGLDPSFGRTYVGVEAEGHLPLRRQVSLPKDADPAEQTFRLVKAAPVEGRVVDQDGKPVVRAGLRIMRDDADALQSGATTDAEGRFRLPHVAEGTWSMQVFPPEPQDAWVAARTTVTVKGGDRSVDVVIERAAPGVARIRAVVVDAETGAPLAPAEGQLMPVGAAARGLAWRPPQVVADETGLTAERVKAGSWIFWARVPERPAAFARIDVREGDTDLHVRIAVQRTGAITGRVEFPAGRNPPHAAVFAQIKDVDGNPPWRSGVPGEGFARFAGDGAFRLEGLMPGIYRIQLSAHGFLGEAEAEVRSGAEAQVVVKASAAGVLRFRTETSMPEAVAEFYVAYDDGPMDLIMRLGGIAGKPLDDYETVRPGRIRWRVRFEAGDGSQPRPVGTALPAAADSAEGEVTVAAGETAEVMVKVVGR